MKTQRHFYDESAKNIAEGNEVFMYDILPTITLREFELLVAKRPEVYERFRGLVENKFKGPNENEK